VLSDLVAEATKGRRREEPDLRRLYRARRPGVRCPFGDAEGLRQLRRPDQQDVAEQPNWSDA
jgi:hypothetical protein